MTLRSPKSKQKFLDKNWPIRSFLSKNIGQFLMPRDLSYFYTFGGILVLMLISQILTGLVLALHYIPFIGQAFESIENFVRHGAFGWLFRPWHAVGASFFFIAVYIHMARGLYYGSYREGKAANWVLGMVIFVVMMATAFFGYVLVWGQMSYVAATVVSNFFLSIPFLGESLRVLFLGGYEVGQSTLSRFYVLHFLLPFILIFLIFFHIWAVHLKGQTPSKSSKKMANKKTSMIRFYPYYWIKDIFAILVFILFFAWFLFYMPYYMGSSENFSPADPLVPMMEVQPEWYFLPFYAIIKSINFEIGAISSTTIGVWLLFLSILVLFLVPKLDRSVGFEKKNSWLYRIFFWLWIADFIALGIMGAQPTSAQNSFYIQLLLIYYFIFFLIILPLFGFLNLNTKKIINQKNKRKKT